MVEKIISRECREEEFNEGAAFLYGKTSNKPKQQSMAPAAEVRKLGRNWGFWHEKVPAEFPEVPVLGWDERFGVGAGHGGLRGDHRVMECPWG